jgi:hypothetical protein
VYHIQRAKKHWEIKGDRNTDFFHLSIIKRHVKTLSHTSPTQMAPIPQPLIKLLPHSLPIFKAFSLLLFPNQPLILPLHNPSLLLPTEPLPCLIQISPILLILPLISLNYTLSSKI